jgi:hypothetical protein
VKLGVKRRSAGKGLRATGIQDIGWPRHRPDSPDIIKAIKRRNGGIDFSYILRRMALEHLYDVPANIYAPIRDVFPRRFAVIMSIS